jgi:2'-5' RNA ligase
MALIRTFIAVEVSPQIHGRVADLAAKLRGSAVEVKWVADGAMHWTLKFLGGVDDRQLNDVCQAVADAVRPFTPFEIQARGAGAFPSAARPRTLWVGAGDGAEAMIALAAAVEKSLKKLGFPKEPRRFAPHLTIGRIRDPGPQLAGLSKLLAEYAEFDAGATIVDEVVVFSSRLEPAGPVHEAMSRAELAG